MSELLNKNELRLVSLAGVLMLAADQDFDKKEWKECEAFVQSHWLDSYGDPKVFLKEVVADLRDLFSKGVELDAKVRMVAQELHDNLRGPQRGEALEFIQRVIKADGRLDPHEDRLYKILYLIVEPH